MISAISEQLSRPEQRGDVHVVSAGMHDGHFVAVGVGGLHGAGVIESGGLFDWQRVHVGSQQHRGARSVA